jgi:hypothetical protein
MAFLPNTGEKDDRTVAERSGPQVHAYSRWFESNKITHWLLLRIMSARVPWRKGFLSRGETYRAVLDKIFQD